MNSRVSIYNMENTHKFIEIKSNPQYMSDKIEK